MFNKIPTLLGISVPQYRLLLQNEKTVEKRSTKVNQSVIEILGYVFCVFIGIVFMLIPLFIPIDNFTYSLIGISTSMFMVLVLTFHYLQILVFPINYHIIAHTPITSLTYFCVKLSQILSYAIKMLVCTNFFPSFGGIWIRDDASEGLQFLFPVVYFPIACFSGFFIIGLLITFPGYITKLYIKKSFRKIAEFIQLIFPVSIVFIGFPMFFITKVDGISFETLQSITNWFYPLPNAWFAGSIAIILGEVETRFIILSSLALITTSILILGPLRSIGETYSEYLSLQLESDLQEKSELIVKPGPFEKIIRNRVIYAGFCLGSTYLYRDKRSLQTLILTVGTYIFLLVILTQLPIHMFMDVFNIEIDVLFLVLSYFFCNFGVSLVSDYLKIIRFSDHWKASWMFKLLPLASPQKLWRGFQTVTILYFVIPLTFLALGVAIFFLGINGIFFIFPNLTFLLFYVLFHPKPPSGIPLSEEITIKRAMGCSHQILSNLAIAFFIGIQYVVNVINSYLYIGLYCVIVFGGLFGFIYLFIRGESRY